MYYKLIDPGFWLYFALFIVAAFSSWIVPGWVTLYSLKVKNSLLRLLLAMPVGLSLWGLQAYTFGYLQLRFLSYCYLIAFALLGIYQLRNQVSSVTREIITQLKRQPPWLYLVILISSFLQVFGHIGSGFLSSDGLKFYFVNAADGVMHLSYIQELKTTFPPFEPGSVGQPLINYHYWSDLILADISRIWGIPIIHLFFQYAPILFIVWTTILFVVLLKTFGGRTKTIISGLFLLTFGADAAFIFTELLHHVGAEHVASLDSGVTFIFNFPQTVARLVLLGVLLILIHFYKTRKFDLAVIASVMIATLFGFKIYYGIYALVGFGFVTLFEIIQHFWQLRKHVSLAKAAQTTIQVYFKQSLLLILSLVIALAIYLPANKGAGGLTFSFFEWPHHLLSADNIDFRLWWLRLQVYEAAHNTRDIFALNILALSMTFVAVYGTRMLGFWPGAFMKKTELAQKIAWFFIPVDIIFVLIGLLMLQTSGGLNIYNFLIVPILSFNIFAAFTIGELKTKWFVPIFIILMVFTLPRPISQLTEYATKYAAGKADLIIPQSELDAYQFIRANTQPNDIVQALLSNKADQLTPYVAFMTGRPSYIAGVNMLDSHNQPTKERLMALNQALSQPNLDQKNDALKQLSIRYLVLSPEELTSLGYHESDAVYTSPTTDIVAVK